MTGHLTGAGLLGVALLASGCVQGDAPRARNPVTASAAATMPIEAGPREANEHPPAMPELATTIIENPDPAERREAIYAIADAEGPDRASIIGQALTDPDAQVRAAAVEAMTGIDDGTAADWLSIGLGDPDARVRRTAVEALGDIRSPSAELLLQQALGDADAGVREAAKQMLDERVPVG